MALERSNFVSHKANLESRARISMFCKFYTTHRRFTATCSADTSSDMWERVSPTKFMIGPAEGIPL
jgi:hypothetical protein